MGNFPRGGARGRKVKVVIALPKGPADPESANLGASKVKPLEKVPSTLFLTVRNGRSVINLYFSILVPLG